MLNNKVTDGVMHTRRGFVSSMVAAAALAGSGAVDALAQEGGPADGDDGERAVYVGRGEGRRGDIVVSVTLRGKSIESIEIVKHHESFFISYPAINSIPAQIVAGQSLDVDVVSGSTMTSTGIVAAVADALAQAGLTAADLPQTGKGVSFVAQRPIDDIDVVVVGAGVAGLSAAARCLQNGLRTVLVEESQHVGGSVCVSDGNIQGAGSTMQQIQGTSDSADLFYEWLTQGVDEVPYPETTRMFADMNGEVVDWLDQECQLDFGNRQGDGGIYQATQNANVLRTFHMTPGGEAFPIAMMDVIVPYIQRGAASIVLGCRVTGIVKDGGAVSGVRVTYKNGVEAEFSCHAVVCATGGFAHDAERMGLPAYTSAAPSTASGHGWGLLEAAGAQMIAGAGNSGSGAMYCVPDMGLDARYKINAALPGVIWVNDDGVRFANEDESAKAGSATAECPGGESYLLFSEAQRNPFVRPLVLTSYNDGQLTPGQGWRLVDAWAEKGLCAWMGQDARSLAEAMGIDSEALEETLAGYNIAVDAGEDGEFGRAPETMQRLEGVLYAIKGVPAKLLTNDGARINADAQVLDADDEPIPGLYAAGEAVSSRQVAPGNSSSCYLNLGATLGYQAAQHIARVYLA